MKIGENEKLIVRSVAQTENDKTYSPKKKITGGFKKVMDAEEMVVDLLDYLGSNGRIELRR